MIITGSEGFKGLIQDTFGEVIRRKCEALGSLPLCRMMSPWRNRANIISYGAPVMPGAMFLYAQLDDIPVLGTPSAVSHNPITVLDLVLPRILCGEKITREDILELGHGGLCLNCARCTFPVCPFGK